MVLPVRLCRFQTGNFILPRIGCQALCDNGTIRTRRVPWLLLMEDVLELSVILQYSLRFAVGRGLPYTIQAISCAIRVFHSICGSLSYTTPRSPNCYDPGPTITTPFPEVSQSSFCGSWLSVFCFLGPQGLYPSRGGTPFSVSRPVIVLIVRKTGRGLHNNDKVRPLSGNGSIFSASRNLLIRRWSESSWGTVNPREHKST